MSTDSNDFDIYLKENLWRDLGFRAALWVIVSLSIANFAISDDPAKAVDHALRIGKSFFPLANSLGIAGLICGILALLLKDLEATTSSARLRAATRGRVGGFIRRTAGDLTLWTLAGLAMFSLAYLVAIWHSPMKAIDVLHSVINGTSLALAIAVLAGLNVLVRRHGPSPLVRWFPNLAKCPTKLGMVWLLMTGLLCLVQTL